MHGRQSSQQFPNSLSWLNSHQRILGTSQTYLDPAIETFLTSGPRQGGAEEAVEDTYLAWPGIPQPSSSGAQLDTDNGHSHPCSDCERDRAHWAPKLSVSATLFYKHLFKTNSSLPSCGWSSTFLALRTLLSPS